MQDLLRSAHVSSFLRELRDDRSEEGGPGKTAFGQVLAKALANPVGGLDGMRVLQALTEDPSAKRAFDLFTDRRAAVVATPEYSSLKTDELVRPMLDFLELKEATTPPPKRLPAVCWPILLPSEWKSRILTSCYCLPRKTRMAFIGYSRPWVIILTMGTLPEFFSSRARDALSGPSRTLAR